MAVGATDISFEDRVMVRQLELRSHFEVALKARRRRSAWIDDRLGRSAALDVQASRSVARFAAHIRCIVSVRLQAGVCRCGEITGDRFVTRCASVGTDKLRAGNARGCENGAARFECAARKQNHGERNCSPDAP